MNAKIGRLRGELAFIEFRQIPSLHMFITAEQRSGIPGNAGKQLELTLVRRDKLRIELREEELRQLPKYTRDSTQEYAALYRIAYEFLQEHNLNEAGLPWEEDGTRETLAKLLLIFESEKLRLKLQKWDQEHWSADLDFRPDKLNLFLRGESSGSTPELAILRAIADIAGKSELRR